MNRMIVASPFLGTWRVLCPALQRPLECAHVVLVLLHGSSGDSVL